MKKIASILILLVGLLQAQQYAVVSNSFLKNLSKYEIKAIFLKKKKYHNSVKLVPVNLPARNEIRKSFEKNVLGMGFARLHAYWNKEHYLGVRPPLMMHSEESVKKFIKNVEGAIGYMRLEKVDKDMVILYTWSK